MLLVFVLVLVLSVIGIFIGICILCYCQTGQAGNWQQKQILCHQSWQISEVKRYIEYVAINTNICPYTAKRRDVLGNTSPEAWEIAQGRSQSVHVSASIGWTPFLKQNKRSSLFWPANFKGYSCCMSVHICPLKHEIIKYNGSRRSSGEHRARG